MGRKPNSLILEYFERGAKLEDASNRYHHTCKSCGEHFPKGRSDTLTAHLTRRCPSLSLAQRTAIVLQFHDLADPSETKPPPTPKGISKIEKNKSTKLPFSPSKQNFNALNVLAEASRRVGANQPALTQDYSSTNQLASHTLPVDPNLDNDPFPHNFLNTAEDGAIGRVNGFPGTGPGVSALFPYLNSEPHISNNDSSHLTEMSLNEHDMVTHGPDLPSIAASANDMVSIQSVFDLSQDSSNIFDHFHNVDTTNDNINMTSPKPSYSWVTLQDTGSIEPSSTIQIHPTATMQLPTIQPTQQLRPIAISPIAKPASFIAESGTAASTERHRKRGKFSDERRVQVQNIRKMGACLRCRMLKKSCTGSNPCDVCKAIENPRLWRHPCIRTKLAAELQLFHLRLQSTLSYHEVSKVKETCDMQQLDGRIEAFHTTTSKMVTFGCLKGQPLVAEGIDNMDAIYYLIDTDRDNVTARIEQYLKDTSVTFSALRQSHFLTVTLSTAHRMSQGKPDSLLCKTLELWSATLILVDKQLSWEFIAHEGVYSDDTKESILTSPLIKSNLLQGTAITNFNLTTSYRILNSQLRSVLEKHAGSLSKFIMGDLERRLLQRQQNEHFETFIIVVIYLNCVERMTWMFQTWGSNFQAAWPLQKSPEDYAAEAEQFAGIIDMLLEMRNLSPKVIARSEDDILVPQNDNDEIRQWLQEIAITANSLKQFSKKVADANDCQSLDGKLLSCILHPEHEGYQTGKLTSHKMAVGI